MSIFLQSISRRSQFGTERETALSALQLQLTGIQKNVHFIFSHFQNYFFSQSLNIYLLRLLL
jgi:hypothetical protein